MAPITTNNRSDESTFHNLSPPAIVRNDVRRPLLMSRRIQFPADEDSTVENAEANATLQVIKGFLYGPPVGSWFCFS